jgi:hypothetical protein
MTVPGLSPLTAGNPADPIEINEENVLREAANEPSIHRNILRE